MKSTSNLNQKEMKVIKLRVLADDSRLRQVKNNEKVCYLMLVLPVEFKNKHFRHLVLSCILLVTRLSDYWD